MAYQPITYRNLNRANPLGALAALERAGKNVSGAIGGAGNFAEGIADDRRDTATQDFLTQIQGINDLNQYDTQSADILSRAKGQGTDVDFNKILTAAQNRDNTLRSDLTTEQNFLDSQYQREQNLAQRPLQEQVTAFQNQNQINEINDAPLRQQFQNELAAATSPTEIQAIRTRIDESNLTDKGFLTGELDARQTHLRGEQNRAANTSAYQRRTDTLRNNFGLSADSYIDTLKESPEWEFLTPAQRTEQETAARNDFERTRRMSDSDKAQYLNIQQENSAAIENLRARNDATLAQSEQELGTQLKGAVGGPEDLGSVVSQFKDIDDTEEAYELYGAAQSALGFPPNQALFNQILAAAVNSDWLGTFDPGNVREEAQKWAESYDDADTADRIKTHLDTKERLDKELASEQKRLDGRASSFSRQARTNTRDKTDNPISVSPLERAIQRQQTPEPVVNDTPTPVPANNSITNEATIATGREIFQSGNTPNNKLDRDALAAYKGYIESTRPFTHAQPRNLQEKLALESWEANKYNQ